MTRMMRGPLATAAWIACGFAEDRRGYARPMPFTRRCIAGVAALGLVLLAPACSEKTKNDVKNTATDLSSDAKTDASKLSSGASSFSSSVSSDQNSNSSGN